MDYKEVWFSRITFNETVEKLIFKDDTSPMYVQNADFF